MQPNSIYRLLFCLFLYWSNNYLHYQVTLPQALNNIKVIVRFTNSNTKSVLEKLKLTCPGLCIDAWALHF